LQVRLCILLLVKHGCDPNQVNKKGESALHSLFAHHGGRPLFYQRDRFSVAPNYLLTLLENMQPLMETLLECGANANLMAPPNVVSPLYYLMRIVCSMSPSLLGATAEQVCQLLHQPQSHSVHVSVQSVAMQAFNCQTPIILDATSVNISHLL